MLFIFERWHGRRRDVESRSAEHVLTLVKGGQAAPRARRASEMPSSSRSKEIGRTMIAVDVGRAAKSGAAD
jgi:hypothetical protein